MLQRLHVSAGVRRYMHVPLCLFVCLCVVFVCARVKRIDGNYAHLFQLQLLCRVKCIYMAYSE